MYVSYPLEKEASMYPGSIRCNTTSSSSNNNSHHHHLPAQNFASTTSYTDYVGFHHMQNMDNRGQPPGPWGTHYGPQREDWNGFGSGLATSVTPASMNGSSPSPVPYASADYGPLNPASSRPLASVETINTEQISSHSQRQSSYEWMRKTVQSTSTGKTRTREKYRVVYTDHQRLELEKEFHYSRYITIRRKSELAANLRLSERQVKIWFQNRRAKERKLMKKKMTTFDGSSVGSIQSDSGSMSPIPIPDPQTHSEMAGTLFPPPPPPPPPPLPPPPSLAMNSLQHNGNL
ncbi:homeobox protein CDX-4 [Sceloporus undulatus]|uniref:homeobox protein CDX-4 n=1 Tax=Sceloporus undulatus TaxID=8520 RepID=UPI001C4AB816|nr:homeobox protein CDX-4 [Sceloporus undulatus]